MMSATLALKRLPRNFSQCRARLSTAPPPITPKHSRRRWTTFAAVLTTSLVAGTLGAIYPPPPLSILFPRAAPGPPAPDTPEAKEFTANLEQKLQALSLLQELRTRGDATEWYETRPYKAYPEERRVNNLTAGALAGPGKLAIYPLVRSKRDESESLVFLHLGRGLCGHDGIIHGGLLATLLDESLARIAINNLPEKVGVTAQLSIKYKAPTMADQFVVIKTKIDEVNGRKATVTGRVEDLQGTLLVEASAMFVQPRYAKLLNTGQLRKAMGEAPASGEPILLADGQDLSPGHKHR